MRQSGLGRELGALAQELINYVRDRIAHYKAPRPVDFVDDLPRTTTRKLAKNELQEHVTAPAAS
ncbi:AMP-binding enzyme [Mycobacterium sp.]|uniref:AMP-binding enzyme n=1 Tax=Mycobacterium sp. TaxID=1785 RepID=UPI003F94CFDA